MRRVVVGMSGGVDSSVVAALLVEAGYEVTGVYVEAYSEPGCRSDKDKRDALKVATQLGISFEVLDLRKEYKTRVVEYFLLEYKAGRTPNPDVVCNGEIKFGLLLDWALSEGYDKLATGHYCRTVCENSKSKILNSKQILNPKSKNVKQKSYLKRARDEGKDQSYFLWRVSRDKLKDVMFPLGELTKSEVREKARELGLSNADKADSMGVCMMGELDTSAFLRKELGEKSGEVIMKIQNPKKQISNKFENVKYQTVCNLQFDACDLEANYVVIGRHRGLWFSTIGQRVGSEISLQGRTLKAMGMDTTKMPALYVVGKEIEENRIVIGEKSEGYKKELILSNYELRMEKQELEKMQEEEGLFVRIRNLGEMVRVVGLKIEDVRLKVETAEKMWGVAPGQSGVLYNQQGIVVGGGVIV